MEHFFDIFFLAVVAIFILYRLFKVLGQDIGLQPEAINNEQIFSPARDKEANKDNSTTLIDKIREIHKVDPSFDQNAFLSGSSNAFGMIIRAFNEGNKATLRHWVDKKLYKSFEKAIDDAAKRQEVWDNSLLRVQKVELVDIKCQRNKIYATVKFVSEQIISTRDSHGNVIEGDPDQIEVLTDIWTFARNAQSDDPNWTLINSIGNN